MTIALNSPVVPKLSKLTRYLEQINESGHFTNFGPLHHELTRRLEAYLGVKNLLLISNGTLALQVVYKTLGITSAITTPFSFVATTSSLLWQGIDTQFCDIDRNTYNLSPEKVREAIKRDPKVNGIIATHVYGNPCDVEEFSRLASNNNVKVVYDAAHAFGIKVGDKSVLNYGDASILSFHATKVFHTIEGGAIVFKRKEDYEKAKQLINFAICKGEVTDVGINAKLNEYQCAVGLTVLDDIDEILTHRADLFALYKECLNDIVELPKWHSSANTNGAYFPICLGSEAELSRVAEELSKRNIQYRPYFKPSLDSVFSDVKADILDISRDISNRVLCLPLHYNLSRADVIEVSAAVKRGMSCPVQ
ncbi:DegT/DnrJ/EryC1/StrS family aminotransferase [Pseudoalteromonas luteoviolacea]|uniref:DegT/DnrJ/EryC1/StrS aminotransferase family protein n=1 Tax=Pseudoalteromonas luteoviolacea TaxID=43657 RepID=UPI001B39C267|nr:DegT/DnrJ/EryC1/StrS family aminotransferase [Pseudoalteromonas luteoviolacea]MBQ4812049.1 DegT/DnrJ/EryC1/StrS family aminotransferase [Pseudoalteromonas luteoviolacea]